MVPHFRDAINLNISYTEQFKLFLLNTNIIRNSITNLNGLSSSNVIFALDLRNAGNRLNDIISSMEILGCAFKTAHFVIFISPHSTDHTRDIILNWKDSHPNCESIHNNIAPLNLFSWKSSNELNSTATSTANEYDPYRLFWDGGSLEFNVIAPSRELEEVQLSLESKNIPHKDFAQFRDVFYRNFILETVLDIYHNQYVLDDKTQLIFIGQWMINFDIQLIAQNFQLAWDNNYDVVCVNGIKYNGWYYDSFPTILTNNTWFIGRSRTKNTNLIRSKQFFDVNSCNNEFISYDLSLIESTKCKYYTTSEALDGVNKLKLLNEFTLKNNPNRVSLHVPFNFCLKERGNANIAVASEAYAYLGVETSSFTVTDRL